MDVNDDVAKQEQTSESLIKKDHGKVRLIPVEGEEDSKAELEKLRKAHEEERKRAEDYLNRLKYLQADFENYQKRVQKEKDGMRQLANVSIIVKLLDVVDELEHAIEAGKKGKQEKPEGKTGLIEGLEMIFKHLNEILDANGVVRIESVGQKFDPHRHEAVSFLERTDIPNETVIGEIRKGYLMHGKIIRASLVEVARNQKDQVDQSKVDKKYG